MENTDWFAIKYVLSTAFLLGYLAIGYFVYHLMDELSEKARRIRLDMPLSANLLELLWMLILGIYLLGCPYLLVKILGF